MRSAIDGVSTAATSANIGVPAAVASLDAPVASAIRPWLCYRCLWCFWGPVFGISCDDGSSSSGVLLLSAFSDVLSCADINTATLAFLTAIGFPRSSLWLESLLFLPSLLLLAVPMFLAPLLSDYDYLTCFSAIAIRLSIIRPRKPTIGLSIIGTSTNLSVPKSECCRCYYKFP